MTGKRSTQLVGTGRGRVERRSPSAKANLTSHFHSTCSWQPASPRLQRRQRRKRTLGRKGRGKKGFVEPKLTEGEKAQGQQPPSTSRISAKDFPEIRARTLDYTMNLRNHLWLIYIYIYDVSLSRLMDLADLDFPIVKKRRAPSDTNCRGIQGQPMILKYH